MCRPTLDRRQKAAGSGSWSVTAGPAVTHRAHIIHFHTSTVFYSITCVQLLRAEPQLCLSLHIKYLYFGPGTHPLAQIMAQATCWITHITAPIRLPWPLAVSAPAAQYGRLGSSVDCRDDVSVHRLSSWITTVVYMHLTDLFVIYLHAIYLFETAGRTCTSFPCSEDRDTILYCHPRYDTSSSSGRIFALYLWSTMWQIRREEDTETAKLSSRIQMREKMDQVNVTGFSFVTQWCVSRTAWDVSRDRKSP